MNDMNNVKSEVPKRELTPIERGARNSIIWHLNAAGFNVTSISHIMNMGQSTVSRVVDAKPDKYKLMDTVLWGKQFSEPRE